MTASGLTGRVTGLVFVFKSASLVVNHVPTCIRIPKTSTFDKSIMFLHLVVLDGFRSFSDRFRSFQIVLGHFSLLLTLVSTFFVMYHMNIQISNQNMLFSNQITGILDHQYSQKETMSVFDFSIQRQLSRHNSV